MLQSHLGAHKSSTDAELSEVHERSRKRCGARNNVSSKRATRVQQARKYVRRQIVKERKRRETKEKIISSIYAGMIFFVEQITTECVIEMETLFKN